MISDLRNVPHFAEIVAERIWRAFWKDDGHPFELLTGLVRMSLENGPIPTTFVAHEGERFLGTVSVIANDEEKRPQYTPWVAALWVEPEERRNGIGAALVDTSTEFAFGTGAARVYLLSRELRRAYYESLGWSVLEADILEPGLHVLIRERREADLP